MDKKLKTKILNAFKEDISKAFKDLNINDKVRAFKSLENWALTTNEISKEASELFIKALYTSEETTDARITISVENGLNKIKGANFVKARKHTIYLSDKEINHLLYLEKRLKENYNDGVDFNQDEEDRLIIGDILDKVGV